MNRNSGKRVKAFLMVLGFVVFSMVPYVLGEAANDRLVQLFGASYHQWLFPGAFLMVFVLSFLVRPQWFLWSSGTRLQKGALPSADQLNRLVQAREDLKKNDFSSVLERLQRLGPYDLEKELSNLEGQWNALERSDRQGILSAEERTRQRNDLRRKVLDLIAQYEQSVDVRRQYEDLYNYLRKRYQDRLEQKLAMRQPVRVQLKRSGEGTSDERQRSFLSLDPEAPWSNLIRDSHGRLLVTGEPGAGKTTLLLQMALQWLEKDRSRIPLILDVATWGPHFKKMDDWLAEILPASIQLGRQYSKALLAEASILWLFDGIDELPADHRASFLTALGYFGAAEERWFVLTSRTRDYVEIERDAPVSAQLMVQPLGGSDLLKALEKLADRQSGGRALLQTLRDNPPLLHLANTPYYLNLLQILFAQGYVHSDLQLDYTDESTLEESLHTQFVRLQLAYHAQADPLLAGRYLQFLGSGMHERNLVDLELTDIDYSWLPDRWLYKWLGTSVHLAVVIFQVLIPIMIFLFLMLILALAPFPMDSGQKWLEVIGGVTGGLVSMVLIAPLMALLTFVNYQAPELKTVEQVRVSRSILKKYMFRGFGEAAGFGLVAGFLFSDRGRDWLDLLAARSPLFEYFLSGFKELPFSPPHAVFIGLILFVIYWLASNGEFIFAEAQSSLLKITHPYQRFRASAKRLYFSIAEHEVIMLMLSQNKLLPYRVVPFLNDMVRASILESDGASWRFRHRILLDYFRNTETLGADGEP